MGCHHGKASAPQAASDAQRTLLAGARGQAPIKEADLPGEEPSKVTRCPKGHLLFSVVADDPGACDACGKKVARGQHAMVCINCNWWHCNACHTEDVAVDACATTSTHDNCGSQVVSEEASEDQCSAEVPGFIRKPVFDGIWTGGIIRGDQIEWNDGAISQLRIDTSPREMSDVTALAELIFEGVSYTGELRDDGKIHWNDGDVWVRCEREAAEATASSSKEAVRAENDAHPCNGCPPVTNGGATLLMAMQQEALLKTHEKKVKDWNKQVDGRESETSPSEPSQLKAASRGSQESDVQAPLLKRTDAEKKTVGSVVAAPRKERCTCCC